MTAATQTPTDFLLAQIAKDEAAARAACIPAHDGYKPHPELREWQYAPWDRDVSGEVEYAQTDEMLAHKYAERIYVTCDHEGLTPSVGEDVGPHIALHDPARVLAQCEAYRRIVKEHRHLPPQISFGGDKDPEWINRCSAGCNAATGTENDDTYWVLRQRPRWPCPTLLALASIYADREGFREEWRL